MWAQMIKLFLVVLDQFSFCVCSYPSLARHLCAQICGPSIKPVAGHHLLQLHNPTILAPKKLGAKKRKVGTQS